MSEQKTCQRCGECCRKGGPALHQEDLPLVQSGALPLEQLMTLRKGEPAYDQPAKKVLPLEQELVKIKGRGTAKDRWTCVYYEQTAEEQGACGAYEARPMECRLLACWDTAPLEAIYNKGRITRKDILPQGSWTLDIIAEHERRCNVNDAVANAERLKETDAKNREHAEQARQTLLDMIQYDAALRVTLVEKLGDGPGQLGRALDFFLGRPLPEILAPLGVELQFVGGKLYISR